ncbi:hypothetical protein [Carnobacterium mobile]|uniref:hypothetical protein n=1 Tax=Carnobacterium mobile TaxID=2750 RepID=UPI000556E062|nr:hypothetical protein [Carnobacterium mobile]
MDEKTLGELPKDELIQLIIEQSTALSLLEDQLESETEENRFFKSLGFVEGYIDYSDYFITFFEDESDGTAKKGSIFLGLFNDFIQDYGTDAVLKLLDQYMEDHI